MTPRQLALSVKPPWAWLLVNAPPELRKDVENRAWPADYWPRRLVETRALRRVWIHSSNCSRPYYEDARAFAVEVAGFPASRFPRFDALAFGALLGTVDIVGWGEASPSPWFMGPWAFATASPRALPSPVRAKGALGFWALPPELATLPAVAALSRAA